ncbi:MAG: ROK family protein [Actinomycetes bacterium]
MSPQLDTVVVQEKIPAILAVDIGGTKLATAVVDLDGKIILRDRVPTPARDPWTTLANLIKRVQASMSDVELVACGVACGGPMSLNGEHVSPLHILSWRDFELRSMVAELTGLATFVDNDAKALALSEGWLGAAAHLKNFMAVVVGTGVGAGLVLDRQLRDGRQGNAGHIGHMIVEPEGKPCLCGGFGCLEAYISGPAIHAQTGRHAMYAPSNVVERSGQLLGRACAGVAAVADVSRVVVGGSVALGWGMPFFQAANAEFTLRSKLSFTKEIDIVPVGLGESSALIGAAAIALHKMG